MLSGNPESFAIWCDAVESWSDENFQNGCFGYFIGGNLIYSSRSTLGVDLEKLSTSYCMTHAIEDDRLFNLPLNESYAELCERAFPSMDSDAKESDFRHLVSAWSLLDDGHNVFIVESGEHAKLIYGNDNDDSIRAAVTLRRGEFQAVAEKALKEFKGL